MCSHATWYEKGEKSTKYFLNLEKQNKTKSHVRKLIDPDGSEETNPPKIFWLTLSPFIQNCILDVA